MEVDQKDIDALRREKYNGDPRANMDIDLARLKDGEPLAYIIGTIPFLGLAIDLSSHPLIPRPETEWWAEELCTHIGERPLRVLDLCAGSGAVGCALLRHYPDVHVSFGEIAEEHTTTIRKTITMNGLDESRADIRTGDLFAPFAGERFDIIASNPPYIPEGRTLPESVVRFEPHEALFGGNDGFSVMQRILEETPLFLKEPGELWMEADVANIEHASQKAMEHGASYTKIRTDQYGRPRLLVAYY